MSTFTYKKKNKLVNLTGGIFSISFVFAAIAVTILTGLTNWGASLLVGFAQQLQRSRLFKSPKPASIIILAFGPIPDRYQDGTGRWGLINHNFYDKNNNLIGGYSLAITPHLSAPQKSVIVRQGRRRQIKS